ncbi:MAG: hypothetical protein AABY11_01595 [archaeon]
MRYILFIGFVFVLASCVSAAGAIDWDSFNCPNATYGGKPIGEAEIALPQDLANFLDGEDVSMHVPLMPPAYGEVRDGILKNIRCEHSRNKTMTIHMSREAIQEISESSYPFKTFKELKEKGKIEIISHTMLGTFKLFFLSVALFFA